MGSKIIPFPGWKTALLFACGFIVGVFSPGLIFSLISSSTTYLSNKAKDIIPKESLEGKDIFMFVIIAAIAGIFFLIKKILTFGWGLLAGIFVRTIIMFLGYGDPLDLTLIQFWND